MAPAQWLIDRIVDVAMQPGLAAAYAAACARHIDRPGLYEDVISDKAILEAVHSVRKNHPDR
ncbi:hypothetical protein I6B53_03225 [Schaalia sp. 19OD2882]|uniref:hypothetical protein n=1 Tax=Schaalia sp. 19OD2882 TaxID=2794089 RepID=UPI001C1E9CEA|nr:hypothetical protein [Schaalia sp. 19OD2882]QWW20122.1 hypothetical protein I6B53_03225 [Schaalia sp. 19OD2882]